MLAQAPSRGSAYPLRAEMKNYLQRLSLEREKSGLPGNAWISMSGKEVRKWGSEKMVGEETIEK